MQELISSKEKTKVLDLTGLLCPIPVVRTSQAIKEIPIGEIINVIASDPGSKSDLAAWATMTGNDLVEFSEEKNERTRIFKFQIRRLR